MTEEHAIQEIIFVYTKYCILSESQEISLQTYTHVFSLEVKMVEILMDLNWK